MLTLRRFVVFGTVVVAVGAFAVAGGGPVGAVAPYRGGSAVRASIPGAGVYVAVAPARILDTRVGVGSPAAAVGARATVNVPVAGRGGIPTSGVSAVVVNLTVDRPAHSGYVTAYSTGLTRPVVSDANFQAGATRAHLVVAELGTGGQVSLYNGSDGTVQLIADVSGYYTAGSATAPGAFTPVIPARILDTRIGLGATRSAIAAGGSIAVAALNRGGVPAVGVSSVVLNVTVADPGGPGYVAFRNALLSSVVNFPVGVTAVSNLAVEQVDPTGHVTLYNNSPGTVQLVVDVLGYYTTGAPQAAGFFAPDGPVRVLDTRQSATALPIPAHAALTVPLTDGVGGVPADASAVAMNVTVPHGPASGYLTVYAAGTTRPVSSTVNFQRYSVANLALTALGTHGAVTIYNSSAERANVVLDVAGYVGAVPGPLTWTSPTSIENDPAAEATSISCPSVTFCMVVNSDGSEIHYNGSRWSRPVATGAAADTDTSSVSCVSSNFCVAVGLASSSDVFRDGVWTAVPMPSASYTNRQVSCVSTTFCMAVDDGGAAYAFNGTSWGPPTQLITDGEVMAVSCVSSTFCMAAGEAQDSANPPVPPYTDAVFHFDGSAWGASTPIPTQYLQTVSCVSTTFCLAAGWLASVVFDGSHWSAPRPMVGYVYQTFATSCISTALCVGAGSINGTVSTYTSAGWTDPAALDSYGEITAISCPNATLCIAIDLNGNAVTGT